jgi:hypothetical protein
MPPVVAATVVGEPGEYVTVRLDEGCPGCGRRHIHAIPAGQRTARLRPGCLGSVHWYMVEVRNG